MKNRPKVGLGAVILNAEGYVLVGKRKGTHAPYYSIPGGYLELGETFEQGLWREVKEETGLSVISAELYGVTNNLKTYEQENIHTISLVYVIKEYSGNIENLEPHKCENWIWTDPTNLPQPHFEASEIAISSYFTPKVTNKFQLQSSMH